MDCPFCHQTIDKKLDTCPECWTSFKSKKINPKTCNKHSCGSGDQTRKTEGDYEGGYVD